ncbi:MAG: hypothetical protein LBC56_01775 [Oscillospiraceae bacterium]|nr:hypothetical protein [Oscillospiraceae bacterium]
MKRKIYSIILGALLLFSLTACNNFGNDNLNESSSRSNISSSVPSAVSSSVSSSVSSEESAVSTPQQSSSSQQSVSIQ